MFGVTVSNLEDRAEPFLTFFDTDNISDPSLELDYMVSFLLMVEARSWQSMSFKINCQRYKQFTQRLLLYQLFEMLASSSSVRNVNLASFRLSEMPASLSTVRNCSFFVNCMEF